MRLRRRIMNECKGNPRLQKAVAMALFIKSKIGRGSTIRNYSVNKLHGITGISATTIKKYMPVIIGMGLAHFEGKGCQHLVMGKMCSHTDGRNICVDRFVFDSFKETYNSLRAYLVMLIQSRKDFIRRTIQTATNPKRGEDYKAARKTMKRLVREGVLRGMYEAYREYGIGLARIAKETGNCIRTACKVVKYAVEQKWMQKKRHFSRFFAPNVNFMHVDGFTFSTRNNLYKVSPNTYSLNKHVASDISYGIIRW